MYSFNKLAVNVNHSADEAALSVSLFKKEEENEVCYLIQMHMRNSCISCSERGEKDREIT